MDTENKEFRIEIPKSLLPRIRNDFEDASNSDVRGDTVQFEGPVVKIRDAHLMRVRNVLTISDEEFLAESIRCWQEALRKGDMIAFQYWAIHALSLAREL